MDSVAVASEAGMARASAPPTVRIRDLTKSFGPVHAVRGLDMTVPRNSIYGFLGPNGAGKSTSLRMLVGLLTPTAGEVTLFGIPADPDDLELRRRIGYLPQQPRFYPDLTARETLAYAGGFFLPRGPRLDRRIEDLLEVVGLAQRADRPVGAFSGGERQRLGLAQAQLHEPELLVLDEPAAGLDPIGRRDVLELLVELRSHATVLYSTHILDDVQRVSDTVGIVASGSMIAEAPIDQLLAGTEGAVYDLTTTGAGVDVVDAVRRRPWVASVEVDALDRARLRWAVAVTDEGAADRDLLRTVLADRDVAVTAFGRRTYELEDAFVRLVETQPQEGHA